MAVVIKNKSANITVKSVSGVFTSAPGSLVTLNNLGAVVGSAVRLDGMIDVVEGTPANNSTLVYNSSDDKYYVQALTLDGGSF